MLERFRFSGAIIAGLAIEQERRGKIKEFVARGGRAAGSGDVRRERSRWGDTEQDRGFGDIRQGTKIRCDRRRGQDKGRNNRASVLPGGRR